MLLLKVAFSFVLGFTVFAAVLAALLPAEYRVVRTARISRPAAEVARIVGDVHQRTAWIPWVAKEPGARYIAVGDRLAVGSTFSFDGREIGAATVRLESLSDTLVRTRVTFTRPMAMEVDDSFELNEVGGATEVSWVNQGKLAYGPNRFFGLFTDRVIGADYAKGLDNLRRYAETGERVDAHDADSSIRTLAEASP